MAKKEYNADSIDWYTGLEGVRAKPGMYIGDTDSSGINHLVKEIAGNSIDEASNGHGDVVGVYFGTDGWIWVYDKGRGVPVGPHPKNKKIDTLTVVFTELHAGGKMKADQGNYQHSIGTHGLGAAVTNALCTDFQVWSYRNKRWNHQSFREGKPQGPVKPDRLPKEMKAFAADHSQGTVVRFKPDPKIFDKGAKAQPEKIVEWLNNVAYFTPKVKFMVGWTDSKGKQHQQKIHQPKGLVAFRDECLAEVKAEPMADSFTVQTPQLDIVLQWSTHDEEYLYSYCNAVETVEGGTHLNGLNKAIAEVLGEYAGARSSKYRAEDLRYGLVGALNVKLASPAFTSQTKEKLKTAEATNLVYDAVFKPLTKYFAQNKALAKDIIARANEVRNAAEQFKLSKQAAAQLRTKGRGKVVFPVELSISTTKDAKKRELFVVEGDSAGGTAKDARNTEFQEVLKLGGKPPNIYQNKVEAALNNKHVLNILQSIGYEPGITADKLRVGKIVFLSDPDVDGYHINYLLAALLFRLLPEAYARGMVYVVDSPLFMTQHGGKHIFGASLNDVKQKLPRSAKAAVTRIKGWGEVNADVLENVAFDPKTRKLTRIEHISGSQFKHYMNLIGENVEARRELLGLNE